jgi:hypothetical protein
MTEAKFFPYPAPLVQRTVVIEYHDDVWHGKFAASEPSDTVGVTASCPKLNPKMVIGVPPLTTLFVLERLVTPGASNVNDRNLVPTTAATVTVGLMREPTPMLGSLQFNDVSEVKIVVSHMTKEGLGPAPELYLYPSRVAVGVESVRPKWAPTIVSILPSHVGML